MSDVFRGALVIAVLWGMLEISNTLREGLTDIGNSLAAISKQYRRSDNAYPLRRE